jgi:hypothetical protein
MGNFGLIDTDTPESAYTFTSMETGEVWDLVSTARRDLFFADAEGLL